MKATAPSAEFARAASGTPVGDGGVEMVEVDAGGVTPADVLDEPDTRTPSGVGPQHQVHNVLTGLVRRAHSWHIDCENCHL